MRCRLGVTPLFLLLVAVLVNVPAASVQADPNDWFGIQVVDADTDRGVPLVELETVHHVRFVTDSAGWVALNEPELMNRPTFFHVRSHGYEMPADGFGVRGKQFTPRAGERATLKLRRVNIAERLYRITGGGIYRDSVLLGIKPPLAEPLLNGQVLGQDTVMTVFYRDRFRWFWGDTLRPDYPLGQFRTSGAISKLPEQGGLDPSVGVDLQYFTNDNGFSRPMCGHPSKDGVIWIAGLCSVRDSAHAERLLCFYSRRKDLEQELDHGLMRYDDDQDKFVVLRELTEADAWRHPDGQTLRWRDGEVDYLAFASPVPNVRVRATWEDATNPAAYEAFGLWEAEAVSPPAKFPDKLPRDAEGQLRWRWGHNVVPIDPKQERDLIAAKKMTTDEARFLPRDAEGRTIVIHAASVHWNAYLKRWLVIGEQYGGTSLLGEIWLVTADAPTGPWRTAVKILTHDKYTFYNPAHHPEFDADGGRVIYFEGTYTNSFSGNPDATPRYDYNQIMYRVDLADPRLQPVVGR
ncbi:MAG: hypothetical protein JSS27_15325 [Planctomycetes bacterium]|nr:hypothetical protein [Planctomycetota bacterium]